MRDILKNYKPWDVIPVIGMGTYFHRYRQRYEHLESVKKVGNPNEAFDKGYKMGINESVSFGLLAVYQIAISSELGNLIHHLLEKL